MHEVLVFNMADYFFWLSLNSVAVMEFTLKESWDCFTQNAENSKYLRIHPSVLTRPIVPCFQKLFVIRRDFHQNYFQIFFVVNEGKFLTQQSYSKTNLLKSK